MDGEPPTNHLEVGSGAYGTAEREVTLAYLEPGMDFLAQVLQAQDEELRGNRTQRKGWAVVRREDSRPVLILLGDLGYQRTHYRPRRRIDPLVESFLERATEHSYRTGGAHLILQIPQTKRGGPNPPPVPRKREPPELLP